MKYSLYKKQNRTIIYFVGIKTMKIGGWVKFIAISIKNLARVDNKYDIFFIVSIFLCVYVCLIWLYSWWVFESSHIFITNVTDCGISLATHTIAVIRVDINTSFRWLSFVQVLVLLFFVRARNLMWIFHRKITDCNETNDSWNHFIGVVKHQSWVPDVFPQNYSVCALFVCML